MDFDEVYEALLNSCIDVILQVLQEYFGPFLELIDTILLLTA
jgi:hypothetical protein